MLRSLGFKGSPASPASEGKAALIGACAIALFMLVLNVAGLSVTAAFTSRRVLDVHLDTPWTTVWDSYGAYAILLPMFACTVVSWLLIIVGICACWPGGWIFQRRLKRAMKRAEAGGGYGGDGVGFDGGGGCDPPGGYGGDRFAGDAFDGGRYEGGGGGAGSATEMSPRFEEAYGPAESMGPRMGGPPGMREPAPAYMDYR